MTDPVDTAIEDNATGPASASLDGESVTQHRIPDQIAARQHSSGVAGAAKGHRGLRFTKLIPPGANS